MTPAQVESKSYTFDEFIHWYPEDSERRYELHDGTIIEMPKPRGQHSTLTGFLIEQLLITVRAMGQGGRWVIPRESILKPPGRNSGYEPDTPLVSPAFPRFNPSAQQIFTLTPWGPFPVS